MIEDILTSEAFQGLLAALATGLVTIVTVLVGLLARKAVAYLQLKLGENTLSYAKQYATTVVRALEQDGAFQWLNGAEKKERAILTILQWAETNQLPIDRQLLEGIIEEAVQVMNAEAGAVWEEIPAPPTAPGLPTETP